MAPTHHKAQLEESNNQGIIDGRPEGRAPDASIVTLDTVTDSDASKTHTESPMTGAGETLGGATSADVHDGIGKPGSGMSSKELHHNGQPGRKRDAQGISQWGPPHTRKTELDRAQRE
ncbi:hypothetical protein BD779DRAFT_1668646 [Infundibulicybe gibba]|nr:hypothetical protein BD779DRAFT_1668646 [Infundibulicybe gibba]